MMTVICKRNCNISNQLLNFVEKLECQEKINIISDELLKPSDFYYNIKKYEISSFPHIVLNDREITGFTNETKNIIKNYLQC